MSVSHAQVPLTGRVLDEAGQPVAGAELRLLLDDGTAVTHTITDVDGRFSFAAVSSGDYRMVAEKSGYFAVERQVQLSTPILADVILPPKPVLEDSINVQARPDGVALKDARPSVRDTLSNEQLELLPTGNSRNFLNALPLSSSVVKDRDGRLHVRGAGSQSIQYQVDGINVTDPVTGNLRSTIPTESIENVDVVASGYAPEYGRASGGLVRIETRVIPDKWRFSATDMVPNYSFRQRAIAEFAPRLMAEGPLRGTPLSLMYSISGEYRNLFNEELPRGENAESRTAAEHLMKLRYAVSDLHLATITLLFSQRRVINSGLTQQAPVETTVDTKSQDYIIGLRDRFFFDANTLLESSVQFNVVDQKTRAKGTELLRIWPNRRQGNSNIDENRYSRRVQWNENFSWSSQTARLTHQLKAGLELASAIYEPRFWIRPLEFYRYDGALFRRTWYEKGHFRPYTIRESGFFAQDAMTVLPNLILTYGFRTDSDSITGDVSVAPRFGAAWYPGRSRKTRINGAVGYFYDRLLLTHLIQDQFPRRVESVFTGDGSRVMTTYSIQRVPPGRLRAPFSRNWEAGIERELAPNWLLRLSYLRRAGRRELRQIDTAPTYLRDKEVWLEMTNTGVSDYKSFDVSTEASWKQLRFSMAYTWSRSMQSLLIDPFAFNIRENVFEIAPSDWDTPHRWIGWALFPFFKKSRAGLIVEARSGFPFSVRNEFLEIVGDRNSRRFPRYFNLGFSLERVFPFTKKYRVGVRLSGFNLTKHFNPTFVDSNLASPEFLQFGNSPRRSGNIRLRLLKRQ